MLRDAIPDRAHIKLNWIIRKKEEEEEANRISRESIFVYMQIAKYFKCNAEP